MGFGVKPVKNKVINCDGISPSNINSYNVDGNKYNKYMGVSQKVKITNRV